jgi:glycosyltransferase involved in cell wall biosynthesis
VKIAAIVPALNEEKNIANVLKTLFQSIDRFDEVIVVDGGSQDKTAEISQNMGAKVINFPEKGKGNAMLQGVKNTAAEILFFCDADLIGFLPQHVASLIQPVLRNEAVMSVGIRERRGWGKLSHFLIKLDPLLAIAGERVIPRYIFEAIPADFIKGFMVETALNYYCRINNLPVSYVKLKGLSITIKEAKWGMWRGFTARLKMFWELIKIRALIFRRKNEFKNMA